MIKRERGEQREEDEANLEGHKTSKVDFWGRSEENRGDEFSLEQDTERETERAQEKTHTQTPRRVVVLLLAAHTHLSHLSLLFLHGSQLIALRARFGGGGRPESRAAAESEVVAALGPPTALLLPPPDAVGERARVCFVREGAVMEWWLVVTGELSPLVLTGIILSLSPSFA